ncbi:BRCA2-interacting transcriptional repressor EMSY [Geodia barretti]|nr:BRCA2-interacting transcriptional repressor EMSY [Geodia barretti]
MTAFRAQGPLTGGKKCSLDQLGKLLGISSERHRAEVRRAANDELLSAIASCVCSADSEEMWVREGQKLASTNPRFVARQLSHLPHLLTSATVSSALSLQTGRADPELRKNTSTQVQNVLKYIISQNPLNSVTTAGVKQALGKISLPTSAGKTLVKSPSKSSASSEISASVTTTSIQPSSSTPSTTNTSSPSTASQSKTPVKEEKLSPTGNKDIALSPSMARGASSTGRHSVHTPEKVVSGKQGKGVTGAKSPMLVGLLEVRKTVGESSHDAVITSQSEGGDGKGDGNGDDVATLDEEKMNEVESKDEEKMEEEEETGGKTKVDEKQGEKAADGKDSAHKIGGVATKEDGIQPQMKETCQTKEIIAEEEEKDRVKTGGTRGEKEGRGGRENGYSEFSNLRGWEEECERESS